MPTDPESAPDDFRYLRGFGDFSAFIASDNDHTSAIYKRFDKLAARDLLYYQSELAELQEKQDSYDKKDANDGRSPQFDTQGNIQEHVENWARFKESAKAADGRWRERMGLAMEIRKVMKEYREALLLDAQLRALGGPGKRSMEVMSKIFHPPKISVMLTGASSNLYPNPTTGAGIQESDYVAVVKQPEPDLLTLMLLKKWPSWFGHYRRRSGAIRHAALPQEKYFSLALLNLAARFITSFLAIGLLVAPMISLYYVSKQEPGPTIGLIVMFTVLFTGTVALVTNANRSEIFGATAAYAAVLVVFVSGSFASGGG